MDNLEWPLNRLDLIEAEQCASDTAVQADDSIVDYGSKWEPVEQIVDFVEDGIDVCWLLAKTTGAFFSKAERVIDPLILVVASQQMNLLWELHLQGHQKANCLKRVCTSVNVVS